jgi:hypothetical protein
VVEAGAAFAHHRSGGRQNLRNPVPREAGVAGPNPALPLGLVGCSDVGVDDDEDDEDPEGRAAGHPGGGQNLAVREGDGADNRGEPGESLRAVPHRPPMVWCWFQTMLPRSRRLLP